MIQYLILCQLIFAQENNVNSDTQRPLHSGHADNGIHFEACLIGDYFANLFGGIQTEDSYMTNVILQVELDMDKLIGVNGLTIYASGIGIKGEPFLENTGAIQGISNISGVNHLKLYETWIEQKFFEDKFSILFGLYDLNSEFDVRESSGIFVNPSFGIGFDFSQSGKNGPSIFPYTSLALRMKLNFSNSLDVIAGVFDGVPGSLTNEKKISVEWNKDDGTLLSAELIFRSSEKKYGKDYSKLSFGGWYYTSNFEKITGSIKAYGNYGIFFNAEKFIYAEKSSREQGLSLFGRVGMANSSFNSSDFSILGGISYTGLFPDRDEDVLGFAFSSVHISREFRNLYEITSSFETILELTYSIQALSWFRFQPDIQFVLNPVAAPNSEYAFVGGTRIEMTF